MTAQEIKELRLRLGLSQFAFAHKLGVTVTSISRWENGHTKPLPVFETLLKRMR